jgi:porphobilinogen synthase
MRRLVRENHVRPEDLVWPLFVVPGSGVRREIGSMPGVFQTSVDEAVKDARRALDAGLGGIILFGIPPEKDAWGSGADDPDGIVQETVRAIKLEVPGLLVMTDVCLCEYTDHGHCGLLDGEAVANDPTLDRLVASALSHARAGADVIAPSDMMDGRVGAIRRALDDEGFEHVALLAYSVKYASGFYGPFREAAGSAPQFGDRRAYQMDPANAREALIELTLDLEEGADMVMVKPAMAYMDIIWRVRQATGRPVACYNVSGEYAMVKAAARNGWIDEPRVVMELLTGLKRAGADIILTYHAMDAVAWMSERG